MAVSRFVPDPALEARIKALHDRAMLAAADEGALVLYENLDESTSARTGELYSGQKRRSSTSKQFSQRQDGTLQGMVDSGPGERGAWFGFAPENNDELEEAKAQELGAPRANILPRRNLYRTATAKTTHRRMNAAVRRAVG